MVYINLKSFKVLQINYISKFRHHHGALHPWNSELAAFSPLSFVQYGFFLRPCLTGRWAKSHGRWVRYILGRSRRGGLDSRQRVGRPNRILRQYRRQNAALHLACMALNSWSSGSLKTVFYSFCGAALAFYKGRCFSAAGRRSGAEP